MYEFRALATPRYALFAALLAVAVFSFAVPATALAADDSSNPGLEDGSELTMVVQQAAEARANEESRAENSSHDDAREIPADDDAKSSAKKGGASLPKTGDESIAELAGALGVAALVLGAFAIVLVRRYEDKEQL